MNWNKTLAPVLIAAAVMLGGASVATASSVPGAESEFRLASVEVSATATASATPTAGTNPATICANAASNPSLGVLCPLWTAHTLNERSEQILGALIVRVANGGTEAPTPRVARTPRADGTPKAARTPRVEGTPKAGQGNDERRAAAQAKLVANCTKYLADNPAETGPRAQFCKEVLQHANSTATPTTSATPSGTATARGFFRPQRGEHVSPRGHAPGGKH